MVDELWTDPRVETALTAVGMFAEAFLGLGTHVMAVHTEHGLAGNEFDVLIRLARSPERRLRMPDLAAQTGLSTSSITRVVDGLEARGLAQRAPVPGDRRGWLATLTDAGYRCLAADVPPLVETIERWFIHPVAAEQLPVFLSALRAIRDAVRPEATAGAVGDTSQEPRAAER